jgi:hypothetical protein
LLCRFLATDTDVLAGRPDESSPSHEPSADIGTDVTVTDDCRCRQEAVSHPSQSCEPSADIDNCSLTTVIAATDVVAGEGTLFASASAVSFGFGVRDHRRNDAVDDDAAHDRDGARRRKPLPTSTPTPTPIAIGGSFATGDARGDDDSVSVDGTDAAANGVDDDDAAAVSSARTSVLGRRDTLPRVGVENESRRAAAKVFVVFPHVYSGATRKTDLSLGI